MSDKIFEACQYLKCTSTVTSYDQDNIESVEARKVFDGDFVPQQGVFEFPCVKGESPEAAEKGLEKVIAGRKGEDLACTAQGRPIVREVRSFFDRIECYLNRPKVELCQGLSVSKTHYVAHAAFDDIEADIRPVEVTKDKEVCAEGATLNEARVALGKEVSDVCEGKNVRCEDKGGTRFVIKDSLLDRVGDLFADIGRYFGADKQPRGLK